MTETTTGYIPQNDDGSFNVPRSLRGLVSMASGIYYNHHEPTLPHFLDEGDPNSLQVQFEGNEHVADAIVQTAWTFGQPFLQACEANLPLKSLSERYYDAVAGIRQLGRDTY